MATPLRLQETPGILTILSELIEKGKLGWKEKLFAIGAFKEHVFKNDVNNKQAADNLRKAALCQKIKQELVETKDHFASSEVDKGKACFEQALSKQKFIQDQTDLKVEEIVYKAMWEQIGSPTNVPDAGKKAFENPQTELQKRQAALQKGIDAFEKHWSSAVQQAVPDDIFASEALDAAEQENRNLQAENQNLKGKALFWASFFKWTGLAFVGVAVAGLLTYIFAGPGNSKT